MLIWNDMGGALVNFDSVAAVSMVPLPDGTLGVIAFCNGSQTLLTVGDEERLRKCLQAVQKAWATNQKTLDLRDELGQRPEATPGLIVPQGVPAEALRAAEDIIRRQGNGGRS